MAEVLEQQHLEPRTEEPTLKKKALEFTASREFDAPRELVFNTYCQAEHLEGWWGCKGSSTSVLNLDCRSGGEFRYSMKAPGQKEAWHGKLTYVDVRAPEEMTYIVSFTDEKGNDIKHPLSATWPMYLKATVSFKETSDGKKTLIDMLTVPYKASDEEIETFNQSLEAMRLGCKGSFDQLHDYLTSIHNKEP